jgi:hypothetical protein
VSGSLTAQVGSTPSPEDGPPDHAASMALDRLGISTIRRRRRGDRKVTRAFHRYAEAWRSFTDARTAVERARADEARAWATAGSGQDDGHPEDRGRRGVPTWLYSAILVGLWALNLPIAVATFQVFGESLAFTVLLAIVADALFLTVAHMVGVTFRRAHGSHDPGIVLGLELPLGWCLFALGILGALTSGWVRWSYLDATGSGFGAAGVLFTTILAVATFLLAMVAAWRHHEPAVTDAERATRRRRRAERRLGATHRRLRRRTIRCTYAVNRRRLLAQRIVGNADRRIRHAQVVAVRGGTAMHVEEPLWLQHERRLADMPVPGSPLQPLGLDPASITPHAAER